MRSNHTSEQLTQEQVDEFKSVFDLFDADGDGYLTRKELASIMNSLGMSPTEEELDAIFIETDADLTGSIEFPEFVAWIADHVDITSGKDLLEIFSLVDLDGNGYISIDEFRHLLNSLKVNFSDEEVSALFDAADSDGNGIIDYNEFVNSGEVWNQIKLTVAVTRSFKEVLKQFTQLAENPDAGFGVTTSLSYGRKNAIAMGYDVSKLPDQVWDSSCMCGNSFALGPVHKGETVIDLGCGAGADLCVAAGLVGETGRVIGVDMTAAMVKKARENAKLCAFKNIKVIQAPFDMVKYPDIPVGMADVVISNGTFNLSPRKQCAFIQAFYCLKPGGRFHLIDIVRHGSSEIERQNGSWCDRVAGAITIPKVLELMEFAGFEECQHTGFSDYRTSDFTVAATFTAKKPEDCEE